MLIFFVKQMVFSGDLKMPSLEVSVQAMNYFQELICVVELRILCYALSFQSKMKCKWNNLSLVFYCSFDSLLIQFIRGMCS